MDVYFVTYLHPENKMLEMLSSNVEPGDFWESKTGA